jgi:hypothetical protein
MERQFPARVLAPSRLVDHPENRKAP